jgi:hypothetical protein
MQLGALLSLPSQRQAVLEKYVKVHFLLRRVFRIRPINKESSHMGYIPTTSGYVSLRHHVLALSDGPEGEEAGA